MRILDELVELNFNEITFIIGHKGEMIRDYVTSTYSFKANFVEQEYLPGEIKGRSLWKPQSNPAESRLREWLRTLWKNRF